MGIWADAITTEAQKLILRYENYSRALADEERRCRRRTTGDILPFRPRRPNHWTLASGFNPYLARSRAERIGHSIQAAIRSRTYRPRNAVEYSVPKRGGGRRTVSVYQVADNAVSKTIFASLLDKNRSLMSPRSYAYRDDVRVHDAVHYVASEFKRAGRMFIAEYDFKSYFDMIDHNYLKRVLRDGGFLITSAEEGVIEAFLSVPTLPTSTYAEAGGPPRDRGVPQGTSISLFLANVAAWELDRALERLGVGFVRYADDTLIWSPDYNRICRAAEELHRISGVIGVPINFKKSQGIRLLTSAEAPAEIQSTPHVEFLGHRISCDHVSIRLEITDQIKAKLSQLLYFNLIREPLRGTQKLDRLTGGVDLDYQTLLYQMRRYLYGNVSERALRRLQRRRSKGRRFWGVMSFFPLMDDMVLLRQMDSWLRVQTGLALKKRYRLLRGVIQELAVPYDAEQILDSARLPSMSRASLAIRRAVVRYGPSIVAKGIKYD